MKPTNDDRARLIAAAYHDDWDEGRSAQFARTAARSARRRRAWRRGASIGITAAILAFVTAAIWPDHPRPRFNPETGSAIVRSPVRPTPAYEVASDDELLRHLKNRPVLVVTQTTGQRDIVLLDTN